MDAAAPDALATAFRMAMRRLASGVAIVTARGEDGPVGIAATSITSLTLEPPAILVCVNRASSLHACLAPAAPLAISLLARHQRAICDAFGGGMTRERRFEVGNWDRDCRGLPTLAEAEANLCCSIDTLLPYGTHMIVIAKVDAATVSAGSAPLVYQNGAYL